MGNHVFSPLGTWVLKEQTWTFYPNLSHHLLPIASDTQ